MLSKHSRGIIYCLLISFYASFVFAQTGTWAEISLQEAYARYNSAQDSAFWIDARSRSKYEKGHIKGAVNIPAHLVKYYLDYIPKDRDIILYCGNFGCSVSSTAAGILINNGFSQERIKVFKAGYSGWKEAGYPIEGKPELLKGGRT